MLFSWLKNRRRRRLLADPFPPDWFHYLDNVAHYGLLSSAEKTQLRSDLRIFIAEKKWEGCAGLQVTDEMRVTIAAQACILTLGIGVDQYRHVRTILIYPDEYQAPVQEPIAGGGVLEGTAERLGEAHYRGPVVLSWVEAQEDAHAGDDRNLILHEFAHQLDMLDGEVNGTPPLPDRAQYLRWQHVMSQEYRRLVLASERGGATLLDDYGATSEGEFFAVATECFFGRPVETRQRHRQMYELLREYYRQDPAERLRQRDHPS
jgi:Mlc titration factor MtfA (ptsG expression regulator)